MMGLTGGGYGAPSSTFGTRNEVGRRECVKRGALRSSLLIEANDRKRCEARAKARVRSWSLSAAQLAVNSWPEVWRREEAIGGSTLGRTSSKTSQLNFLASGHRSGGSFP